MAVKSVADRASIAASGAAAGDQIVISGKNETWEVVANKLNVPTSTLCVKLANGNFAALSVKETVARNEPAAFPEFSNTAAYTAGQTVRYNGSLYTTKSVIAAGAFKAFPVSLVTR